MSREHAEIVRLDDGRFVLKDRGSRCGTFVNDEQVTERPLRHHDKIRLGRTGSAEMILLVEDTSDSHASLMSGISAGGPWTVEEVGAVWSAAVSAAMECKTAVSAMYDIAGTSALYTDFILERGHRDIHAAMQHVVIQPVWLEQAGRVKLGLEPSNPLYAL